MPEEASQTYEWCPGNWPEEGVIARRYVWSPRWLSEANKYKQKMMDCSFNEFMYV